MTKDKDRFLFTVEIYDNKLKKDIVVEGFNTNSVLVIIVKLNQIIAKLSGAKEVTR